MFSVEIDEIESIEACGIEDTYDITVEDENHLFFANDILVHNCAHAVSYGYISYQCAKLAAYYEPEWLCTYVEHCVGDPDAKRRALSEVKAQGYRIAPVDVNRSGYEWEISEDGRTFYPSFLTVKGVGAAAVKEILAERPYSEAEDLLWRSDGSWRHSKFNVKAIDALCRVGAFSGLVGPGKRVDNDRQLHHVLTSDVANLKKRLKRTPDHHLRTLDRLVEEAKQLPPWPQEEIVRSHVELLGSIDDDVLLDAETRRRLESSEVICIDELEGGQNVCWFVLSSAEKKRTKNGKPYFQLSVHGSGGVTRTVRIWNTGDSEPSELTAYACYYAIVKRDSFGYSCRLGDLKKA